MIPRWTRNLITNTVVSKDRSSAHFPIQSPIRRSARNGKSFQFQKTFFSLLPGRIALDRGNIDRRAQTVRPKFNVYNVARFLDYVTSKIGHHACSNPRSIAREEELRNVTCRVKNIEGKSGYRGSWHAATRLGIIQINRVVVRRKYREGEEERRKGKERKKPIEKRENESDETKKSEQGERQ